MTGKLYENSAFESGRENSGKMSFSGSFEFGREIGERVWFAGEPFGGTADRPEIDQTKTQDSIDNTEIHAEHPDYSPRASFRRLVSIANEEALSMTDVQDTKTIVDAVLKRIEEDTSLSPAERHTLEVVRALKDLSSRMTRVWTDELHTLRDKKQSLDSQGKSMEADEADLLALLERFHAIAPFNPDRTDLDASGKYKIPEAALIPFKTAVDGILATEESARSQDQKDLVWAYDMLVAGDPLTEELEARRMALNTAAAGALATPSTHAPLSTDESLLLSALEMVNTHASYGIAHPKAFTHLGRDWKEQVQKFDDEIYELQIGATNMSRQEVELIYQLNNKNFMGTQISTMDWMSFAKFDPGKFGETFVGDQRRLHKADATPDANDADIALALGIIATNIKLIKGTVQSEVGIHRDIRQTHLERMEAMPLNNLGREIRRLGRRMKRGIELSMGRASDTEKAVAIGGAVVLLGALLMSKNKYAEAFRKFALGGGAGLAALLAIDVGSGAFFNGKRLSQKALGAMRIIGDGVSDEFYRVFEANAQGNTQEEKRVEVGHLATLASMAQSNKFSELLTKYRAAIGTTNEIHLDGVPDDGTIGDLKQKPSVVFFLAMDLFYRRYGKDIERWEAENDGKLPLASLTFMEILLEMVSQDKYYKGRKHPFHWFANQVQKAGAAVGEWSLVTADRVGEYESRFFGDKAKIGDYLQEVFPEDNYGKGIGFEKGSPDEHVLTLPGGVRVEFREETREKVQDKSPGREVNGFSLHNPYKDGPDEWKRFGLDSNNRDDIMDFCKELILDTAVHKMPSMISDPRSAETMRKFREAHGQRLDWSSGEQRWFIPGFQVPPKTYSIKETDEDGNPTSTTRRLEFPGSHTNIYLNVDDKLDKAGFAINFYRNDHYWDKGPKPTEALSKLEDNIEKDNFKRWMLTAYHFPFAMRDIEIDEENWKDIKKGEASSIEGYVKSTTRTLSFTGRFVEKNGVLAQQTNGAVADILSADPMFQDTSQLVFEFNVPGASESERSDYFNETLIEIIERRFDGLKGLAGKTNERWFKKLFSVKWPWEYFKDIFGGSVDEAEWQNQLENRKQLLIGLVRGGNITPESMGMLNDMLRALARVEEELQKKIGLNQEVDKNMFEEILTDLETLNMPAEARAEYMAFRSRIEHFYNFEPEAFQKLLGIYQELMYQQDSNGRTVTSILNDPSASTDDKQNAVKFLGFYTEKITMYIDKSKSGKSFGQISKDEVDRLDGEIKRSYENDTADKSNHTLGYQETMWPTFQEYISPVAGSRERMRFDFIDNTHKLHRMWMYHTNLVTQPLLSKMAWKPFGFNYAELGSTDWGKISPQLLEFNPQNLRPSLWGNKVLGFPMIADALERTFAFEHYDIIWRVLDVLGLYPQGLAGGIKYPVLSSVNNFKRDSATHMEQFIRDHTINSELDLYMGSATASDNQSAISSLFPPGTQPKITADSPSYEEIMYLAFNEQMKGLWSNNRLSDQLLGANLQSNIRNATQGH